MRYFKSFLLFACFLFCLVPFFPATAAVKCPQIVAPAVTVDLPPVVGDGTAFPAIIKARRLSSASVTFLERAVTAQADENGTVTALLPVPLEHASGSVPLFWKAIFDDGSSIIGTATVHIQKKTYPAQHLTLAPKYVTPDPALKERIDRERALLNAALTTKSPVRHWELPMRRPLSGKVTSWYGLRRILNGQPRNPHKGLDFRGAEGTPIGCVADGTVVLTGDFYYPGMFAVVDHGLGVTSIYMHMSAISVTQGQQISAGDTVGLVGSTGRSTGPHLHLGVTVLGQSIDAFPLLAMTEEDTEAYAKAFSDAAKKEGQPKRKAAAAKKTSGSKQKTGARNTAGKGVEKTPEKSATESAGATQ